MLNKFRRSLSVGLVILLVALSAFGIGCVKKPNTATGASAPSTTDLQNSILALQAKVAQQAELLANLSSTSTNYQPAIKALQDTDASIGSKLTTIDTAINSMKTSTLPKYAMVSDLTKRYVEVKVYGVGDYPVIITLLGEGLAAGILDVDKDATYSIEAEYLYGTYTATTSAGTTVLTIPTKSYSSELIPSDPAPNAHEHEVTVSGLTVSVPNTDLTLAFSGTMLVIVIEPDDKWKAEDEISLDLGDLTGTVYYASASIGASR